MNCANMPRGDRDDSDATILGFKLRGLDLCKYFKRNKCVMFED